MMSSMTSIGVVGSSGVGTSGVVGSVGTSGIGSMTAGVSGVSGDVCGAGSVSIDPVDGVVEVLAGLTQVVPVDAPCDDVSSVSVDGDDVSGDGCAASCVWAAN